MDSKDILNISKVASLGNKQLFEKWYWKDIAAARFLIRLMARDIHVYGEAVVVVDAFYTVRTVRISKAFFKKRGFTININKGVIHVYKK